MLLARRGGPGAGAGPAGLRTRPGGWCATRVLAGPNQPVRVLAGPPYWAELLLTAAVTAAGAWTWSRIDGAEPRETTRH